MNEAWEALEGWMPKDSAPVKAAVEAKLAGRQAERQGL